MWALVGAQVSNEEVGLSRPLLEITPDTLASKTHTEQYKTNSHTLSGP